MFPPESPPVSQDDQFNPSFLNMALGSSAPGLSCVHAAGGEKRVRQEQVPSAPVKVV